MGIVPNSCRAFAALHSARAFVPPDSHLREHEAGAWTGRAVPKNATSSDTFYNWNSSITGLRCRKPSVCSLWRTRTVV